MNNEEKVTSNNEKPKSNEQQAKILPRLIIPMQLFLYEVSSLTILFLYFSAGLYYILLIYQKLRNTPLLLPVTRFSVSGLIRF